MDVPNTFHIHAFYCILPSKSKKCTEFYDDYKVNVGPT